LILETNFGIKKDELAIEGSEMYFIYFLLLGFFLQNYAIPPAVTYTFEHAGRFGDCVLIVCKAKFFAVERGLSLLYKPFPFSDELTLHTCEIPWTQDLENKFANKKRVTCARDIEPALPDTLYIVDLFTTFADVAPQAKHKQVEPVDHWINLFADEVYLMMQQNSTYKKIIKEMLKPIKSLPQPKFPAGCISVAVHIRMGTGYDGNLWSKQLYAGCKRTNQKIVPIDHWVADCACPLRFPPLQFYIQQINVLAKLFDDYPLYVQIFTDDVHPQNILDTIQQQCPGSVTITLGTVGGWQGRTIDDIYFMSMFDCLIRPCSSFSGVSQIVSDHKLIIRPDDFCFDDQALYITDMIYTIHCNDQTERIRVPYEIIDEQYLKNYVRQNILPTSKVVVRME
jgi:hypothetical protein